MTDKTPSLSHPKYWKTWFLIGLWKLFSQLPLPVLRGIGHVMAFFTRKFAKRRCFIAQRNLQLCFPEKSPEEIEQLLRKNLFHTAMNGLEMGMCWFQPHWRLKNVGDVTGLEYLENLEGGALMLSMHNTTIETMSAVVNPYFTKIDMMYRAHKNPVFDHVQRKARGRHNSDCKMIDRSDLRGAVKVMRSGRILWYAPDQDYGIKQGVFATFFGIPAATITATPRLARLGKVPVVPIFHRRDEDGRCQVEILPPLENFPSDDEMADIQRVNDLIEAQVRKYPEQYLWVHRRFKTRPPGAEPLYGTYSKGVKKNS